jgi:hypothetical protein
MENSFELHLEQVDALVDKLDSLLDGIPIDVGLISLTIVSCSAMHAAHEAGMDTEALTELMNAAAEAIHEQNKEDCCVSA